MNWARRTGSSLSRPTLALRYEAEPRSFDVGVSCVGGTWIAGGLAGTLELMRRPLLAVGLLLVGEPVWPTRRSSSDSGGPDFMATMLRSS